MQPTGFSGTVDGRGLQFSFEALDVTDDAVARFVGMTLLAWMPGIGLTQAVHRLRDSFEFSLEDEQLSRPERVERLGRGYVEETSERPELILGE